MHGWADGRLGELGEGMCGLAGRAFLADPSAALECSGQENRVTVVAGQGLVPAGSWVTVPQPFALCMAFPRRLSLWHLPLHPTLISPAGLAKAHQC